MADKTVKELETEIAVLKDTAVKSAENLEAVKAKAVEINEGLQSDNDLLKKEIKDLKNAPAKKDEKPVRELSVKEKGFTTIQDVPKIAEQYKNNAPEQNDSKK